MSFLWSLPCISVKKIWTSWMHSIILIYILSINTKYGIALEWVSLGVLHWIKALVVNYLIYLSSYNSIKHYQKPFTHQEIYFYYFFAYLVTCITSWTHWILNTITSFVRFTCIWTMWSLYILSKSSCKTKIPIFNYMLYQEFTTTHMR